jgi:glycerophosphoryl diester phosphodiesterase
VNIELKSYETADKVVDLIEHFIADKYWNYNQFIVSSFDWNACSRLSFEFSNTHWCINRRKLDLALAFEFIQARSIHPDYHLLTAENTAKLQERGSKFSLDSERTKRPKKKNHLT